MCSPDSLPVVLHLTPTTLSSLPKCGLPSVFQLYPSAFLNLKPSTLMGCKAGLILSGSPYVFLYLSPSPCVSHSGRLVSGSPDVSLHLSPFISFPLWLVASPILASVVWLRGCLSLRVFLHVSPTLASGVRMSSLFTWLPFICLP